MWLAITPIWVCNIQLQIKILVGTQIQLSRSRHRGFANRNATSHQNDSDHAKCDLVATAYRKNVAPIGPLQKARPVRRLAICVT